MERGGAGEGKCLAPRLMRFTRVAKAGCRVRPSSWSDRLKTPAPHRVHGPTMEEARRAFAGGDLATAERICAQVLARSANDGSAWTLLTETALQRGRPDAAIVCSNRALALMPKDPIALVL